MDLKELAVTLFDLGVVQFGDFISKDNVYIPVYFDFRILISHPALLHKISKLLWSLAKDVETSRLCGVPYMAIPLATMISVQASVPMVLRRKEIKPYGTKKLIEGDFVAGENVMIIEDVVVSGSSIMETTRDMEMEQLKVTHALVILDREQAAKENLKKEGIELRSLYTMSSIMEYLYEAGKITEQTKTESIDFVRNHPVKLPSTVLRPLVNRLQLPFSERANHSISKAAQKLFHLMDTKKTTLCLSADLTSASEICHLAEIAGPSIAVLKLHVDTIEDFSNDFIQTLQDIAKRHNFLLMEDRKFCDIQSTVTMQCSKGVHRIVEWADLVSVLCIAGTGAMNALQQTLKTSNSSCGVFMVTQMSSFGALTIGNYVKQSLTIADDYRQIVAGHLSQSNIFHDPGLVQMTDAFKDCPTSNGLNQERLSAESVVKAGADLVIVGLNSTEDNNRLNAINQYKEELWSAFERRVHK